MECQKLSGMPKLEGASIFSMHAQLRQFLVFAQIPRGAMLATIAALLPKRILMDTETGNWKHSVLETHLKRLSKIE